MTSKVYNFFWLWEPCGHGTYNGKLPKPGIILEILSQKKSFIRSGSTKGLKLAQMWAQTNLNTSTFGCPESYGSSLMHLLIGLECTLYRGSCTFRLLSLPFPISLYFLLRNPENPWKCQFLLDPTIHWCHILRQKGFASLEIKQSLGFLKVFIVFKHYWGFTDVQDIIRRDAR